MEKLTPFADWMISNKKNYWIQVEEEVWQGNIFFFKKNLIHL